MLKYVIHAKVINNLRISVNNLTYPSKKSIFCKLFGVISILMEFGFKHFRI